jgi:hypothetical protein
MRQRFILLALLALVATVASAQTLYVPASANAEGANQTRWRSDLQVKARGSDGATFTVEVLEHGTDNSDPLMVELTVAAGESLRLSNLLETEFGFTGTAALRLTATAGQIVVTSRTFNDDPSGTYGQTVPAVPVEQATVFGDQVSLIQLSRSADTAVGFRTNIAVVNTTGETITAEIDLYHADGTYVGTVTVDLQPYDYQQVNDVFAHAGALDVADGYAVVRTTTEGGAFIAYASVVDNRSGDAVLLLAQPDEVEVAPEPQDRLVVFEIFMRPG